MCQRKWERKEKKRFSKRDHLGNLCIGTTLPRIKKLPRVSNPYVLEPSRQKHTVPVKQ